MIVVTSAYVLFFVSFNAHQLNFVFHSFNSDQRLKVFSVLFLLPSQNPDPNTHTVLLCNNYNIIVYL